MVLKAFCLLYLILISINDIKTFRIPDTMNTGFLATVVCANHEVIPFQNYICGILFAVILSIISKVTKGLGGGDIKLIAVLGLAAGFFNLYITLLAASVLSIVFLLASGSKKKLPFAPFITAGYTFSEILNLF